MSGEKYVAEVELTSTICAACGVAFAMPSHMEAELRRTHSGFYCPSGHSLSFTAKSGDEKLREELETAKRRIQDFEAERDRRREQTAKARDARRRKLRAVS
jgi:hypothetical protein